MNVRIIDNDVLTIPDLAARFGIRVGHSNVGTQPTINLEIHGNDTAAAIPIIGPPDGIGIRQQTPFTFCIEGLTPTRDRVRRRLTSTARTLAAGSDHDQDRWHGLHQLHRAESPSHEVR